MSTKFMYLHDYRPLRIKDVEDKRSYRSFPMIGCLSFKVDGASIVYQLSVTNPTDKFNRARSRDIASIRLGKDPIKIDPLTSASELNHWEVIMTVMSSLAVSKTVPSRVSRSAKNWLGANAN